MTDIARDLLEKLPIDSIAQQLGVSRQEVEDAIAVGAPALLGGMEANAKESPDNARSLLEALAEDHDGRLLEANDPLQAVDVADGEKIVQHIFGSNTDAISDRLGAADTNAAPSSLFSKILPMIAPLVMGWLSRKMGGAVKGGGDAEGGLGGVLGDLLGGGGATSGDPGNAGGGIGDLLGGLLGGEGSGGSSGDVGDLIGGLLGGSKDSAGAGPDLGGLADILGGLAGSSGSAGREIPDISDLLGAGR